MLLLNYNGIETAEDAIAVARECLGRNSRRRLGSYKGAYASFQLRNDDFVEFLDPRHPYLGPCHCWLWCLAKGYAFGVHNGRLRIIAAVINQTPEGMETRHRCRNRACINPAHLESGSRSENMGRDLGRDFDAGLVEPNVRLKVTGAMRQQFRDMIAAGWIQTEIAEVFGISQAAVSQHLRNVIGAWRDD